MQELTPHMGRLDRIALNTNYARNFYHTDQRPLRDLMGKISQPTLMKQWRIAIETGNINRGRGVAPLTLGQFFKWVFSDRGCSAGGENRSDEIAECLGIGAKDALGTAYRSMPPLQAVIQIAIGQFRTSFAAFRQNRFFLFIVFFFD